MTRILSSLFMLLFLQPAMAQRKINKTSTEPLQIYMVKVQGGNFDMGSNDEAADRKPAHTVKLSDFQMSAYEVTQKQWKAIMGNNPSQYVCEECPVTNVSYPDVLAFIEKLNTQTGKHYRLPTEAEWEYAARGGVHEQLVKSSTAVAPGGVNQFMITNPGNRKPDKMKTGKKYAGEKQPGEVAWFKRNSEDHVHPIGRKHANELGLYDMSGNVEEWCSDFYATTYGSKNTVENPKGPDHGNAHVVRGGSFESGPGEVVVTWRAAYLPATKASSLGFRLAE
jgi:formylglycine-generating enzyme required for sulfatase activity